MHLIRGKLNLPKIIIRGIKIMAKRRKAAGATLGTGIVFVLFGIVFLCISLGIIADAKKFGESAMETTAVVTDVEKHRVRRNKRYRTEYDVYVQYEIEGVTYNEELKGGNGSMRVGQQLTVYYNPMNRRDVRSSKSGSGASIFAVVFSLLFTVIGVRMGIVPAVKLSKRKKLRETGEQATAMITSVDFDRSIKINKRHPYKAQCEFTDPVTGEKFLYSSESYMEDIHYLVGQPVTVYYDPYDRSKYYVDLDSVDENTIESGPAVHDFR